LLSFLNGRNGLGYFAAVSPKRDESDLELLTRAVLRKSRGVDAVLAACESTRRYPFVDRALRHVPTSVPPSQVAWPIKALREALFKALPDAPHELAELLGLELTPARVLRQVLAGLSIAAGARNVRDQGEDTSQATRWMDTAADRVATWIKKWTPPEPAGTRDDARLAPYLEAVVDYCSELPRWFPPRLAFADVHQEVLVSPPVPPDDQDPERGDDQIRAPQAEDDERAQGRSRPLALTAALQQYRRVLLLGDPGSGKSWAAKRRCMSLAAIRLEGDSEVVPVLVLAARLEERLASSSEITAATLPALLAGAMPEELAGDQACREFVRDLFERGAAVELYIDGYDEIRDERPHVARQLSAIAALVDPDGGRFVLTTRPSSVPQHRFAKFATTCQLQPFAEREQSAFVDTWFAGRAGKAEQVKRWVAERRLDLLRTPLLIALFCAVTSASDDAPPGNEPDLLYRALCRLASDEDRHESVQQTSELVRLRIEVLERVALRYVGDSGLLDSAEATRIEASLADDPSWRQLERLTDRATVLDDLTNTGLLRQVEGRRALEVEFLHSAIRDYLIARGLSRQQTWPDYISRIWPQAEWEPVIAYLAALLEKPDELLLALERRFADDPLNTARFTAGRALSIGGAAVSPERRQKTRDELLILLGSNDAIDRSRSAALLAGLQDPGTAALVRGLVHPAVPTRVVEAALRSIAGGTSQASVDVLASCARDDSFTIGERETAIEALAEIASADALDAVEQVASDPAMQPSVRAAAAFAALRRMNAPASAVTMVTGDDPEARGARWSLAERISAQSESLRPFVGALADAGVQVADGYCRALLASLDERREDRLDVLASALPQNAALDYVARAVETVRAHAHADPLLVTCARFVLDETKPTNLRWTVAARLNAPAIPLATDLWTDLFAVLDSRDCLTVAEFLVRQIDDDNRERGEQLRSVIASGQLGHWALAALQRPAAPAPVAPGPPKARPAQPNVPPAAPDLDTLFTSDTGPMQQYWLLRELRRTIPADGPVRSNASSLTHAIAAVGATAWIDAQPAVAGRVEVRLSESRNDEAGFELARLRAYWPGRQHEVAENRSTFSANILDSRAEAALLHDDLDEAATMALASIGARQAEGEPPTELAAIVLLAAGAASGRTRSTYSQVSGYLATLRKQGEGFVLTLWLMAVARQFDDVRANVQGLSGGSLITDADVAALRTLTGTSAEEAFGSVLSWAGCRRARVLMAAVGNFMDSPVTAQRIEAGRTAAAARAETLASAWPSVALVSPTSQGTPQWANLLVRIASRQILDGSAGCAAAVYAVAAEEAPENASIVNNYGFCLVQVDRERALQQLDRAAALYAQPFGVNVANRMLLHWLRGDHDAALALGEAYEARGLEEPPGGAWLWDPDEPSVLAPDVDIYEYIASLGVRAALSAGDARLAEKWQERRRRHEAASGAAAPAGDETEERDDDR